MSPSEETRPAPTTEEPGSDRLRKAFLATLTVLITVLFLFMVRRFLLTILLAAIFAGMVHPIRDRIQRRFGGRQRLASLTTLVVVVLVVVVPLVAFFGLVANQAVEVSQAAAPWIERQISQVDRIDERIRSLPLLDRLSGVQSLLPSSEQVVAKAGEAASKVGTFLVNGLADVTRGTVGFFFQLFIMLYAMYFFLVSGSASLKRILYYVPLSPEDEERLLEKFTSVARATLKGSLLIGVVQGTATGLGMWLTGVPGAAFWGTVTMVMSLIPAIGAVLVWGPATIYLIVIGHVGAGLALLAWCALGVGSIDNFLRPLLVGRDTKMSDLMVLLSTLGGITLFGIAGVIVGPIVAAVFVTVWHLYGEAFRDMLPGERPADA